MAKRSPGEDATLLDVKLLRLFDQLHATRSVTLSAERLGQSQPTVSIWLARLRRQLHDPLFVRTPQGMQPTPRADTLIDPVREVLRSLRQISTISGGYDPATSDRRFRICMTDASHIALLPQLLARVRALAPGARIVAARIDAGTAGALQSGEADIALGYVPWLEAGFYQQTLYPQDWVCLCGAGHPRLQARLTLREYKEEGHVAVTAGTGAQLLEDALSRRGVERKVMLELPGFLGLAGILSNTDLVATVPRHIGETLAAAVGLRVLACPVPIPAFTVKQHWHARYHQDGGNRWLRSLVSELFMRPERAS
jgi:DNA-binding transcriptional LysR family regulator